MSHLHEVVLGRTEHDEREHLLDRHHPRTGAWQPGQASRREPDDDELLAWAEAGAAGFVLRESSLDELRLALDAASRGEVHCSPALTARFVRRLQARAAEAPGAAPRVPLTPREREIVFHIDQGCSNAEIARRRGIELATVKNHVHHILEKLHARRRSEAAARVAGRLRRSS